MLKRHFTQWTAQFYAAAELSRRKYLVSLTLGNTPTSDLLVVSPKGKHFKVQVKGLSSPTSWLVQKVDKKDKDLFWILVRILEGKPARFFILNNQEIKRGWKTAEDPDDKAPSGLLSRYVDGFENCWETLPK
jgi:hypothetical protein